MIENVLRGKKIAIKSEPRSEHPTPSAFFSTVANQAARHLAALNKLQDRTGFSALFQVLHIKRLVCRECIR